MKIFTGKVISKRMQKTATVLVERKVSHPVYLKLMKRTRKYHVHDEVDVKVGDAVRFVATKPVSKLKKWKINGNWNFAENWQESKCWRRREMCSQRCRPEWKCCRRRDGVGCNSSDEKRSRKGGWYLYSF